MRSITLVLCNLAKRTSSSVLLFKDLWRVSNLIKKHINLHVRGRIGLEMDARVKTELSTKVVERPLNRISTAPRC